jgi:predicted AAA+ superfamily ATPase
MKYFERGMDGLLEKTLKTRPLVYINGPRQTGKSTMARHFKGDANYVSFDSPINLAAVKADPGKLIQSLPNNKLNIIDEIQMVPEIFPYLKMAIDENRTQSRRTGLYLLTGSANLMALPRLSQALVGRMSILTLLPFSSSEYKRTGINFIKKLFEDKLVYRRYRNYDLPGIILNASFPEPALNPHIDRNQWYDDYLNTLIIRDIRTVADIRNPSKIIMLLSILAMRTGGLLNNSLAAQEISLDIKTYERYKASALNTFIIFEVSAWSKPSRLNKRFTKSPKLYFTDTGLLVYLLKRDLNEIYNNDRITMGHIFENFIACEIKKNASSFSDLTVSHFRTSDQKEVDFVLEKKEGIIGIEVKLNLVPDKHDFAGLKLLREATGPRFRRGIVIYPGTELIPFGDELWAVPACYLWEQITAPPLEKALR